MEPFVAVTPDNIQGLTHPLRVQVLGLLRTHGPATATTLAHELGLTSGALSYHLRQLERFGFIAEDTERGNERDRWWKAVHRSTHFDVSAFDGADAEAAEAFEQGIFTAWGSKLTRAQSERRTWPPQWRDSVHYSDVLLTLTPEEVERLDKDLMAVIDGYRAHDPGTTPPPGTWTVTAAYHVIPQSPRPTDTEPS